MPIEPSPYRLWYNDWVQHQTQGRVLDVGKSRFWDYGFPTLDKNPKLRPTYVGDIEQAPFRTGSFDMVLCNGMYEFVDDPQRMIDEAMRIAKDKAIFGFVGQDYKPYRRPWRCYQGQEVFPGQVVDRRDFNREYHFIVCQHLRP